MWIIVHNEVYDVTKFAHQHPGGYQSIWQVAGDDATHDFEKSGHSDKALSSVKKLKICRLAD